MKKINVCEEKRGKKEKEKGKEREKRKKGGKKEEEYIPFRFQRT